MSSRDAEAGEDLPALRIVPVAEARSGHPGAGGPRAAPQNPVVVAEEHLGVLAVGMRHEPFVPFEAARSPLPHVADHPEAAVRGRALGMGIGRCGPAPALVEVGVASRHGRLIAPRIPPSGLRRLIPARRLLPLELGGQPGAVRASKGVGLEPGDVNHRPIGVQRLELPEPPFAGEVHRPASGAGDVVLLLPGPALVGPPLAPLVSAAFDEREVAGVGDRGAADQEAAYIGAVPRAFVVEGEAVLGRADRAWTARDLDHLESGS